MLVEQIPDGEQQRPDRRDPEQQSEYGGSMRGITWHTAGIAKTRLARRTAWRAVSLGFVLHHQRRSARAASPLLIMRPVFGVFPADRFILTIG
ncbi:hypothetical protein C27AD_16716 [Salinisphaera hydrothermalis C27AD]